MALYKVTLAYDGTDFAGFQRQKNIRTVQGVVEEALRKLGWMEQTLLASGRTDTGVHAAGQVVSFELEWLHTEDELKRALNANLPLEVAARTVEVAQKGFHPRYSAQARTYRYDLYCSEERDPLQERFAWRIMPDVEMDLLKAATRILVGTHDFTAFGSPMREGGTTTRTVYQAQWADREGGLQFEVTANAFLYRMVRRLVYLQVLAGQQRLSLEKLEMAVTQGKAQPAGLALPCGLVLWKVWYSDWQDNEINSGWLTQL
jgi:tRNA pseudouridine38-40 synthase